MFFLSFLASIFPTPTDTTLSPYVSSFWKVPSPNASRNFENWSTLEISQLLMSKVSWTVLTFIFLNGHYITTLLKQPLNLSRLTRRSFKISLATRLFPLHQIRLSPTFPPSVSHQNNLIFSNLDYHIPSVYQKYMSQMSSHALSSSTTPWPRTWETPNKQENLLRIFLIWLILMFLYTFPRLPTSRNSEFLRS